MGVLTFTDETTSTVAPAKLFKALVLDVDTIVPKVIPVFKSVEFVEGDSTAVGAVKKITINEGGEDKYVLHKIDAIDEANFGYNYSIIGGVGLPDSVEKILFETKLIAGPDGGSIAKLTVHFHLKGDAKPTEAELKEGKEKGDGLFKAVEGYVLANPNY
ncbi:pathogenesis-related BetVI family protein [Salmonella enterica]